ncbi:MAG: hypothetical protein WD080_11860 [Egibacteraceae bacterium]
MGDARARGRVWACASVLLALLALGSPAAALPLVGDEALGSVVDTATETVGALTDTLGGTVDGTVDTVGGTVDGVTGAVQDVVEGTADALAPPPAPTAVEPPPAVLEPVPAAPTASEPPAAAEPAPVPAPAPATAPVTTPPASAPSTPPPPPSSAGRSPGGPGIVGPVAERAGVPLLLLLLVGAFLSVQGWIDRRDPKLALAPREAAPDLTFPPGSARA